MWFWASHAQKRSVFTVFLALRVSTKRESIYLTIFGHWEKSCRGSSNSNSNNNNNKVQTTRYKQLLGPRRCYLAGVRSPTICISICIWRCIHLSNQIKPNQIKSNLSIYSIYLSSCMFLYIGRDLTQQLFSLSQWLGDVGSPTSPIGFTGVTISTHSPTSR